MIVKIHSCQAGCQSLKSTFIYVVIILCFQLDIKTHWSNSEQVDFQENPTPADKRGAKSSSGSLAKKTQKAASCQKTRKYKVVPEEGQKAIPRAKSCTNLVFA